MRGVSYPPGGGGGGGGAPTDAEYVVTAAHGSLSAEKVLGSDVIMKGTLASRPAAAIAGRLYFVTDAGSERLTRDTGAAWEDLTLDSTYIADLAELATQSELDTHAGAADPHGGYVLESLIDARGDLIAGSADNTPARRSIGTDGQVLTADSAEATGMKWATPAGGGIARSFIRADVNRSLPNDLNLNAIFNSPANGRATLSTGVYKFEGMLIVTGMSATSGNALLNLLGAGTAVVGSWLWKVMGIDNSTPGTILDDDAAYLQVNATAASAVVAGTGTALRISFWGMFEVTTAGTLIPSIDQVTAAAAVVQAGSYIDIERVGDVNIASIGSWD